MDNSNDHQSLGKLDRLIDQLDDKQAKILELDLLKRIIVRLQSFDCTKCVDYLSEMGKYVHDLEEDKKSLDKQKLKEYKIIMNEMKTHLQKKHGLVPEGYYVSIYMSIGMSGGLVLGLTIFDNLALGLPIGLAIGLAIGAGIDADYKKKGMTI